MSRFFTGGSDSDSDSSSNDDDIQQQTSRVAAPPPRPIVQWSDDEDEVKRVVRSAKDKVYDELRNVIKNIKNHKKIKDMAKVLSDLEDLSKSFIKAKKVVDKEGIPPFYIRCLVELEDFVNENWADTEGRKKLNKNNAKGLSTLRQKLRKYNKDFESNIASFRENPTQEEDEEEKSDVEDEKDSSDNDLSSKADFTKKASPAKPSKPPKQARDADDDTDDSFWDSSSESSSDEDDYNKYEGADAAAYFLKSNVVEKEATSRKRHREKAEKVQDDDADWEVVEKGPTTMAERPKMFSKDSEITCENVLKKMNEIISARGKKATDRNEQLEMLTELRKISSANNLGDPLDIKILFYVVASIFDYNPSMATCMKPEMWSRSLELTNELLQKIRQTDVIVGENVSEESENFSGEAPFYIRGCILRTIERLDEEFTKMLQACDAHSTEYVDRLKDERTVYQILDDLEQYVKKKGLNDEMCRIYLKRIEHMYYKGTEDHASEMDRMCKFIYEKDSTDRIRTRAILYHIYHHACHDRWFEARDLMLMSHLQDTIHHSDVATQIAYNRSMVQLGLCAFRTGIIKDAHNCLVDIQSSRRAKELLAQGLIMQRQHERTPEQEKLEKRRQMPYHMHINLELLECVYLVSAMLMEIPYMAAHEFDARRRLISKNFHHVLRDSERQPLVGPPESMREHVVSASKAMMNGDWKACSNYIVNEKMNAKVWDLFSNADSVRSMIVQKIKEESLRTYLFTFSSVYDSLSLHTLADMFELQRPIVHSTISKMILNEELMGSLDEPTQSVVMHRTEPTRLQSVALQLSEKVATLVENNERIVEIKQGNYAMFNKQSGNTGYQNRDNRDYGGRSQNYGGRNYSRDGGRDYGNRDGKRYDRSSRYQKAY